MRFPSADDILGRYRIGQSTELMAVCSSTPRQHPCLTHRYRVDAQVAAWIGSGSGNLL